MKRLFALLLALSMICCLFGCSSKDDAPADNNAATNPGKEAVDTAVDAVGDEDDDIFIGILIYAFANDYMSYVRQGMQQEADAAGVTIEILDAANDQAKQLDQAETLITKGADALIVAAVETEACQTFVDKCKDAGIPIVLANPKPEQAVIDSYDQCWYVGAATRQPGECQAELVLEDWAAHPEWDKNGDGVLQYVLIHGQYGHINAEQRCVGLHETFDASGIKYEELDCQEALWDTTKAKDLVDTWLMKYGDDIEVIISNNDAMALGAIESVNANGYNIPIYGINAIEQGLQALKDGTLMGTVMSDTISEGKICVRLAVNTLSGKDVFDNVDYEITDKAVAIYGLPVRVDVNFDAAMAMYQ